MAYKQQFAPAGLDVEGLRKFVQDQMLAIQRAGTESEDNINTSLTALDGRLDVLEARGYREVLQAARTYYVRTDGNDANTGLVDSAGGAFLTVQKAVDVVASLDMSIYQVTIQVRSGTYTGGIGLRKTIGSLVPAIVGDTTTPSNVVFSNNNDIFSIFGSGNNWRISGVKVTTTAGGSAFRASTYGSLIIEKIDFGTCSGMHMFAEYGGNITVGFNLFSYSITGGANVHMFARFGGVILNLQQTVTLTGTPAFSDFASITTLTLIRADGCSFSGAATGRRYSSDGNSVIYVAGAGATYFPGNVAGVTSNQGLYI